MTLHRTINWLLAALVAAIMSGAYLLDGPSDHQAQLDAERAHRDAQRAAVAQARFAKSAQQACGTNAAWSLLDSGAVQCSTKRGHKTTVVAVR